MRFRNSIQRLGKAFIGRSLVLGALICFLSYGLAAQKVVVLTSADIGKVVTGTHHFSQKDKGFKLTLKHRMGDQKVWQISLQKAEAFEKGPFTLKTALPATLNPDGVTELDFDVSYARAVQQENTISLLAVPMGADPKAAGIAINIKLSADGVLMFFNDRSKSYSKTLPTFEFVGAGEKLLEVTWNGGSSKACTVKIEESKSNAFTLVPNGPGAAPIANGATVNLSNGGTSFFIKYDGAARKGSADVARFTFSEPNGQSVVATMIGTYQGGNSLIAAARDLLTKDVLVGGYVPEPTPVKIKPPVAVLDTTKGNSDGKKPNQPDKGNIAVAPVKSNVDPVNTAEVTARPINVSVPPLKSTPSPKAGSLTISDGGDGFVNGEQAKDILRRLHRRYGDVNLIKLASTKFEKNEEFYEGHLRIYKPDSLKADQDFSLNFLRVKFRTAKDSLTVNAGDNAKMFGDTTLLLKLTGEEKNTLTAADSFQVTAEFVGSYASADGDISADSLVYRGMSYGKVYSNNNWKFILWASLIAAVVLFFVIGFLVSRQAITSFRYLRESRYQRERHNANSTRQRVDVETIHVDLARRDSDLIQLAFVDRGEGLDGRAEGGIEKVRTIAATVPTPLRNGFRRFFSWLFAPFGRKREPKFKSVYYSLRIELPRGSVPQHLRLKDESGMLMLGTSLTGNVLATDHQDFKFVKRPFNYSIYLDPSEFMDYTGAMKTVSIPFRVIEEPFEGYVMTREFNLNLEIAQRF